MPCATCLQATCDHSDLAYAGIIPPAVPSDGRKAAASHNASGGHPLPTHGTYAVDPAPADHSSLSGGAGVCGINLHEASDV